MSRELISKATRNEFREVLVGFTLRQIELIFEGANIQANLKYAPQVGGQRRSLVEQYYSTINFCSEEDVNRLIKAYGEVVFQLERPTNNNGVSQEVIENIKRRMELDGYRYESGRFNCISGRELSLLQSVRSHAVKLDMEGLHIQVERLLRAADTDPPLAIGTVKELVETVCKTILEDKGKGIESTNKDLPALIKLVRKELSLLSEDIPESAKGADTIRCLLSNLGQIVQGLAELRNLYGTGHGRSARSKGISSRHAKLAVGAGVSLATFLLETHLEGSENSSDVSNEVN